MPSNKIVKNTSKAGDGRFGFNYASLADIQEQGFEVPKMRIRPIFTPDGTTYVGDYMEYYDEATKEWNLGSRIISEKMGSMNAQQSRGSSESYARRYTTMMALGLAGQDDKNVEADGIEVRKKNHIDFDQVREACQAIDDIESLEEYYKSLNVTKMTAAQQNYINGIINKRKKELKK
jgi:hypothetical protein